MESKGFALDLSICILLLLFVLPTPNDVVEQYYPTICSYSTCCPPQGGTVVWYS